MIIGQGYRLVVNDRKQFVSSLSEYANIRLSNFPALSSKECEIIKDSVLGTQEQVIDAAKILEMCSPQVESNIFLSHSHCDFDNNLDGLNIVEPLAAMLEDKTGCKVFVDTWYWRDYRKILNELWNIASKKDNSLANAEWLSSNTHCMLLKALAEMIHQCDFFVFLDTCNSMNAKRTPSPWLFCELAFSQLLQRKRELIKEGMENFSERHNLSFAYSTDLSHLERYTQNNAQDMVSKMRTQAGQIKTTSNFYSRLAKLYES